MPRRVPWLWIPLAASLTSASVPLRVPEAASAKVPDARRGAVAIEPKWGAPVREVRRELARLGYASGPAGGAVGARTAAALRELQRCDGIPAGGRIDAATASLLHVRGAYEPGAPPPERENRLPGVDAPRTAPGPPSRTAGADPLDESSMPTVGDVEETAYADDPVRARTDGIRVVTISRDRCAPAPRR